MDHGMREKLEKIAGEIRSTGLGRVQVQLGVSDDAAMSLLASVGAPQRKSVYVDDWTVIASREINIGGVEFKAQADKRKMTDAERAAHSRSEQIAEDLRRLREKEAELEEMAAQTREALNGSAA